MLKPHMHAIEFSQLVAALTALRPKTMLEWGAGGGTKAILEACPSIEKYVSVEHDAKWYDVVRAGIDDPRLSLHLVEPAEPEPPAPRIYLQSGKRNQWRRRAESDEALFRNYINFPATLDMAFDTILVDGRARNFCLKAGKKLLQSGGIIILHDAQRKEYQQTLKELGSPIFLTPWKRGQLCLISG